jgi:hypothetical protein
MGLTFALDWKPKSADGEKELDTQELEKLLSRDKKLLAREDIEIGVDMDSNIRK